MFLPVIENENIVYTLRYKDTVDFNTPWRYWKTMGKPSERMIEALRKDGMHLLELVDSEKNGA